MPDIQNKAEENFYTGLREILQNERIKRPVPKSADGSYPKNIDRYNRLLWLFTAYKKEIKNNLLILEPLQKISLLENCLEEANLLRNDWIKEYEKHKSPHTALNIQFINKLILAVEKFKTGSFVNISIPKVPKLNLESIFNGKNNAFDICKNLLEDLEILIDGETNMKPGRAGKLIGGIMAIKITPGMLKANYSDQQLLDYFNSYLGTPYKAITKNTKGFKEGFDDAKRFLENHFKSKGL